MYTHAYIHTHINTYTHAHTDRYRCIHTHTSVYQLASEKGSVTVTFILLVTMATGNN